MPGSWTHLAARFFDVVGSAALDPSEAERVRGWLREGEEAMFFGQATADQRHGYTAAARVERRAPDRLDLIRAALLHDVGKRHAGLGALGRVAASVLIRLGGPLTPRMRAYRDHGPHGAEDLRAVGAEPLVVAFAEAHHGARPERFDPGEWALLQEADAARVPRSRTRDGYPGGAMRGEER